MAHHASEDRIRESNGVLVRYREALDAVGRAHTHEEDIAILQQLHRRDLHRLLEQLSPQQRLSKRLVNARGEFCGAVGSRAAASKRDNGNRRSGLQKTAAVDG